MLKLISQTFGRLSYAFRSLPRGSSYNPIIVPLWRNFLLQPLPFFLWFRLRWHWYRLRKKPMQILDQSSNREGHIEKNVIPYNLRKIRGYDRLRTERLINVLRSVHGLILSQARVLIIGPRNEMELLLFRLYGFRFQNITAIDLFSYSPHIKVMDMHNLQFLDNNFDVIYSAYTLRYSDKLGLACREITRCVRDGGLVAICFVTEDHPVTFTGERENIIGSRLTGGISELLTSFDGKADAVLWREEYVIENPIAPEKHCSVIFRVVKQSSPRSAVFRAQ